MTAISDETHDASRLCDLMVFGSSPLRSFGYAMWSYLTVILVRDGSGGIDGFLDGNSQIKAGVSNRREMFFD
jgi:hypothetical protein